MDVDDGLEMSLSCRDILVRLLNEFRLNHKATQARNNTCSTMGQDVLSIRAAEHWLNCFQNGNCELDDLPHLNLWLNVAGLLRMQNPLIKSALTISHR